MRQNRLLKENALSVDNYSFSKCYKNTKAANDKTVTLEMRKNGILYLHKQGDYGCDGEIAIDITNEGNTINIQERYVVPSAYCICHAEYTCEIDGLKNGGNYTLCFHLLRGHSKPIAFTFVKGSKLTFAVEDSGIYY